MGGVQGERKGAARGPGRPQGTLTPSKSFVEKDQDETASCQERKNEG